MDLLNEIMSYQNEYASILQRYQILIGVIAVPLLYLLRGIPSMIYERLLLWITIELNFDEADNVSGQAYALFSEWLMANRVESLSRRFEVMERSNQFKISAGQGLQIFKFESSWFLVHSTREKSSQGAHRVTSVGSHRLRTFKWNRNKLDRLIEVCCNTAGSFTPVITMITNRGPYYQRDIPTYIATQPQLISKSTYDAVDSIISNFVDHPESYSNQQIATKETILLYGPPGTGKTSLARHMAAKHDMDLRSIDAKTVNMGLLSELRLSAQSHHGTIVLIEDIDANSEFVIKQAEKTNPNATIVVNGDSGTSSFGNCTIDELLNVLDGVLPLDKVVVMMTTNFKDKLYPSIYRPGRVDHLLEVDYMPAREVVDFLKLDPRDPRAMHILNAPSASTIPAAAIHQLRYAETTSDVIAILAKKDNAINQVPKLTVST